MNMCVVEEISISSDYLYAENHNVHQFLIWLKIVNLDFVRMCMCMYIYMCVYVYAFVFCTVMLFFILKYNI